MDALRPSRDSVTPHSGRSDRRDLLPATHVAAPGGPIRQCHGLEVTCALHTTTKMPASVALQTEKVGPHVVVNANHGLRPQIEVTDQLRSNQLAGARYEHLHCILLANDVMKTSSKSLSHFRLRSPRRPLGDTQHDVGVLECLFPPVLRCFCLVHRQLRWPTP
jgi:hypothetical protein